MSFATFIDMSNKNNYKSKINSLNKSKYLLKKEKIIILYWGLGMGIGDWGFGVWANTPCPQRQTPNPTPRPPN